MKNIISAILFKMFPMVHFNVTSIPKFMPMYEISMNIRCIDLIFMRFSETWLICCNNTLCNTECGNGERAYKTLRNVGDIYFHIKEYVAYNAGVDNDIMERM